MGEVPYNAEHKRLAKDVLSRAIGALRTSGELPQARDQTEFPLLLTRLVENPNMLHAIRHQNASYGPEVINTYDQDGIRREQITLESAGWSFIITPKQERDPLPPNQNLSVAQVQVVTRTLTPQSLSDIERYSDALPDLITKFSEQDASRRLEDIQRMQRHLAVLQERTVLTETQLILQRAWYNKQQGRKAFYNLGGIMFSEHLGHVTAVSTIAAGDRPPFVIAPAFSVGSAEHTGVSAFLTQITNRAK